MADEPVPTATAQGKKTLINGFNIRLDTAKTSVAEKLKTFVAGPDSLEPKTGKILQKADQTQIEQVKLDIAKLLEILPAEYDGVMVLADGMQDLQNGRLTMTIQVYGKKGHI